MTLLWIAAFVFIALSAMFIFLPPLIIYGPRIYAGAQRKPETRIFATGLGTLAVLALMAPLASQALISGGEVALMSAENFQRLSWSA